MSGIKEEVGGFPDGASGKEPTCQCKLDKRQGLDPEIGKIPWRRAWQPNPVFLPRESPWTEEPRGYRPYGSQRVRHDEAAELQQQQGGGGGQREVSAVVKSLQEGSV